MNQSAEQLLSSIGETGAGSRRGGPVGKEKGLVCVPMQTRVGSLARARRAPSHVPAAHKPLGIPCTRKHMHAPPHTWPAARTATYTPMHTQTPAHVYTLMRTHLQAQTYTCGTHRHTPCSHKDKVQFQARQDGLPKGGGGTVQWGRSRGSRTTWVTGTPGERQSGRTRMLGCTALELPSGPAPGAEVIAPKQEPLG